MIVDIGSESVYSNVRKMPDKENTMSILNVEHLTHGFGDRAIFHDVSFRLLKGEHIGLIGLKVSMSALWVPTARENQPS